MSDTSNEEDNMAEAEETKADDAEGAEEDIRPTDIVFDCPNCGHSLCIDYRGAGLQTHCVECGATVQVPIPEGMKLDDLDLSPSELLTQLFQTRKMLAKSEQQVVELTESIESLKLRRTELEKARMTTLHRCAELVAMCQGVQRLLQNDVTGTMSRMIAMIAEEQQEK